jgi:hypothetical protein
MPIARGKMFKNALIEKPISMIEIGANMREDVIRHRADALASLWHLQGCIKAFPGRGLRSLPTWPRRRLTIQQIARDDERELTQRFSEAAKALPLFGKGRISAVRPGESEKGMDEMATSRDK